MNKANHRKLPAMWLTRTSTLQNNIKIICSCYSHCWKFSMVCLVHYFSIILQGGCSC
jgi:hypothetical protein